MLIETLEQESGINRRRLGYIAFTASKRYKIYRIPKRSGGEREIQHPSRTLKAIQRWIIAFLEPNLPIHECATAYKMGASIRANAELHLLSNYTLRLDFEDFFPSFTFDGLREFLLSKTNRDILNDEDVEFVCAVVTRNGRLTIGAPSSPFLSNAAMYSFDKSASKIAERSALTYSRYADDIFISATKPNILGETGAEFTALADEFPFAKLILNNKKTTHLSRKYHRSITGVVITPDRRLSIGRARKREIKSLIFQHLQLSLDGEIRTHLQGLLSFANDVEPDFVRSLERKYGVNPVQKLLRGRQ